MFQRLLSVCLLSFLSVASFAQDETYTVAIDPANFVSSITHPYFSFTADTIYVYEGETEDGLEHIEVIMLPETRLVMGVATTVVRDPVWLDGELVEDTFDWFAQDLDGNVWYFGEDTHEYEDGIAINSAGAWEAGVDGALPGIVMPANPQVGQGYRLEYYAGEAEDMAEILSVGESITIAMGRYENVIMTRDWTPLEPDVEENKYYAAELGLILETNPDNGERIELVALISQDATTALPESTPILTASQALGIGEEILGESAYEVRLDYLNGRWLYAVFGRNASLSLDAITGAVQD